MYIPPPVPNANRQTTRKNKNNPSYLEGNKVVIPAEYGGLGVRFYKHLSLKLDKIHQVDTVTGVTETNGSVRGRSIQLSLAMMDLGITENDIVLISSRCHTEQTIVILASLFLGAIVAPVDPELTFEDCFHAMSQLKPKICFCDIRAMYQIQRSLNEVNHTSILINFGIKEHNNAVHFLKLFTHKETEEFTPIHITQTKRTVAFIVPTQGAVADLKLVCLSHNNILLQTMLFQNIVGYPNKIISFFPLSWMLQTILVCFCLDSDVVRILPGPFNERQACKIIHDLKIDFAFLGTDLTTKLVGNVAIKDYDVNCLKCIMVGNMTTTINDMNYFRGKMPRVKFIQNYALTETGFIAANTIHTYDQSCLKPGSVGCVLNNCKVKIVDVNSREILAANKPGELLFNGDGLMLGYLKNTMGTMEAMEKGFFKTGDLAEYDPAGWLYIEGRIDDLVTMNDTHFSPVNLEDVIKAHPLVRDVVVIGDSVDLLACVIKKPDTNLSPERLLAFLCDRLPENLHPTKFVFLDNFPRTSSGKVKKRVLREDLFTTKIDYTESLASM